MTIQLKNVSYSYQGKLQTVKPVNGVSYEFEPGKCYAIIGKTGSGKTTKEWNRNRMRRDAVSVIYQNYNLFPLLTVQENIRYPLELKKISTKEAAALTKEARARVDLPEAYDKRLPSHLSGGEQQRGAIARTLA